MRKLITIAALLLVAATAQGQSQKYDENHKHQLFSNTGVVVDMGLSYNIENGKRNTDLMILVPKRLSKYWYFLAGGEINGFIPNGFDRYAKLMAGFSFDALPFEVYALYGANFNPSEKVKFGMALKGGVNLQFKITDVFSIRVGGGIDRINNGSKWQSNATATVGCKFDFGITEQDRIAISIDNTMRSEYGELKNENKLLKTELQKCQDATTSIQESAMQMAAMVESLQSQLAESKAETKTVKENCNKSDFYPIVFDFGSAEITDAMDDYIMDYAEMMQSNNYEYRILGYCSANGTDWKNQILSEKRANAVYYRLIAYGVDESRLFPEGKGMSDYDKASEQKVIIVRIER